MGDERLLFKGCFLCVFGGTIVLLAWVTPGMHPFELLTGGMAVGLGSRFIEDA